ncbi:MAG: hypothetical protein QXL10_03305 [Candidatus Bathyarchaeia archaeon]
MNEKMVETYASDQQRVYYVAEATFGVTPANPSMLSVPADQIEPNIDPGNIKLRGAGSYDLQLIKKGLRQVGLKIGYPLPSAAPIELLQWAKMDLNKSLSMQVLYYKGTFASATDIISMLFTGMKFHKVSVSCSIEDVIRAVAEFQGLDVSIGTAKISGATYTDHMGAVAFNETYVKKDTTMLDRVTDWKFDIENNLKRVPVIRSTNGHLLKYLPFRHRNLSGELTFEFESIQEANEVLADTEFTLEFGLGGTCKAVFSGCKWDNVSIPSKMEDLLYLKAPFVAKGPVAISAT